MKRTSLLFLLCLILLSFSRFHLEPSKAETDNNSRLTANEITELPVIDTAQSTAPLPPLAPNPVYPGNGFANVPTSFTVRWNSGLDAARTNSQWPVTYAIYYRTWPIGGTEPASYTLFASALPCSADSTGVCTMGVSGMGAGNYRYYIVANMDVSASTGVSNSILSTQSAPALFSTGTIPTSMIPAPLPPDPVFPSDGLMNVPASFTVRWNDGLDASRRNSLWPVTYAIYYKYWPNGGIEPASYASYSSGLPCNPDSTGVCTMPASGISVGNYRWYVVANMDVSASTGVANSILSTQGSPAMFSEATQPLPLLQSPPNRILSLQLPALGQLDPGEPSGDLVAVDETPVAAPTPTPVPTWMVYRTFFLHLAHLDQLADQDQANGNIDSANGWRTYEQQAIGLTDSQAQLLKQVAYSCNAQVKAVDTTLQTQVTNFRAQYPNGAFLSMPLPPEISLSYQQEVSTVNSCINQLSTGLESSFQKLDNYIQTNFQPSVQPVPVTGPTPAPTPLPISNAAATPPPPGPPTDGTVTLDGTVTVNEVPSVAMYSFITVNSVSHVGSIECGAHPDGTTLANYDFVETECHLFSGTVDLASTPPCFTDSIFPFTLCQGSFIAVPGIIYNSVGYHNMNMFKVPPANSTTSCYWADPLRYGIPVQPPIFDEQGSVFAGRGPNSCWGDGNGSIVGLATTVSKPATIVIISPSQATVFPGGTQQFSANIPVTWSKLQGPGAIDPSTGVYTAPATIDTQQKAIIQGCNKNSISNCAAATITVSPVTLTVSIDKSELISAEQAQLTVNFNPSSFDPTNGVDWTLSPNLGVVTTVSGSNNVYLAPGNSSIPVGTTTVTLTAKSKKNPSITASTTVSLAHIDAVLVSPVKTALFSGETTTLTAVTSPATAVAHTVTWTASAGTVTSLPPNAAQYTAPTITKEQTVTITASVGGISGSTTLPVVPPVVISSVTPPNWNSGEVTQITIRGTGFGSQPQVDFGDAGIFFTPSAVTDPDTTISGNVSVPLSTLARTITVTVANRASAIIPPPAQTNITLNPVAITVALSPASATVPVGQSATFAPNVTCKTAGAKPCPGPISQGVSCVLKPQVGTVTSGNACVYTATPPISSQQSVQITACSVLVPTACASPCIGQTCGTATVSVTPVNIAVSPKNVTLFGGQTKAFTASITNNPNTGVTWSVVSDPLAPANTNPGVIDQNGNYTAPNPVGVQQAIKVHACSNADSSRCDDAPVSLVPLVVTPSSIVLTASKTQAFSATTNGASTPVTWSLDPNVAAAGSITPQGVYTAPSSLSTVTKLTVIATSTLDGSKGTATVFLAALCYPRCRAVRHTSAAVIGQSYSGSVLDPTVETPQGFIYAGNLPPNLNFATTTGAITGIPVQPPAIYGFSATPFYADGDGGTETYALPVCQSTFAPPITVGPYLVNNAYSVPYMPGLNPAGMFSYSVIGTLPPGMSLDTSTGIVSGTPTTEGTYTYAIHAALTAGVTANTASCPAGTTSDATYQATVSCPSCRSANLTPTSLVFPAQMLGTASAAQSVTLTNTGTDTLSVSNIGVSADFTQVNNCGSSLAAHASCTINVTFTPTWMGWRTGTLTVTDNAPGSPHSVNLSGAVLQGYHDVANCDGMAGWAWDSTQPNTPITVYFFDGFRYLGSATADQYRPDLAGAYGAGYHGFSWANDVSLFDGASHSISVHTGPSASSPLLNNSPRSILCRPSLTFAWVQPSALSWGPPNTLTTAGFATGGTGNVALSWRDATLNGPWTNVPYQAPTNPNNGGWSNTIPSADICHAFQATVTYSGISASLDYDGVALGYCSFRVIWIQPQATAGFGPAGSLVVAGSAQGGPSNSQVTLWVRDDTIGSGWAPLSFAPIPDATGIWYNAIENVNYSHQYSVYIQYNDRISGGCSYFGNGMATNCP